MRSLIIKLSMVVTLFLAAIAQANDDLQVYTELSLDMPPGNIAIGPDGRMFISVHEFYGKELKVVELFRDGSTRPYPTAKWATAPAEGKENGLYGVLGLNVDRAGILWMLDTSGPDRAGRLIGWNTRREKLHKIVYLGKPVINDVTFLNDLAIDTKNKFAYLADTSGAIIVVNLRTGQARRVLEGSRFTVAEDIDMVIDGRTIFLGGEPARLGINPATIDPKNKFFYFGAMSGTALYRIATTYLRDFSLSDAQLEARIEQYGDKPISDGITIDGGENVYITSITENAIGVVGPDGEYKILYQDESISWPDGFAYGADDNIYFTVNQLHKSPPLNDGQNTTEGTFKVMYFPALVRGKVGR